MTTFINDIKYSLRQLIKTPGFTTIAVLTLALCIGVNTAMLGVLYRVVLKPLPYANSEQLVNVGVHQESSDQTESVLTHSEFVALSEAGDTFSHVGGYTEEWTTLSGIDIPQRAWGIRISSELLSTLGVSPAIGRAFTTEDYAAGYDHLVLLSDELWRERFGGQTDILGQSFLLDGKAVTVCGVMSPNFHYPHRHGHYWRPLILTPDETESDERFLNVVARRQPGLSLEQMDQRLLQLSQGFQEQQASSLQSSFVAESLLKTKLGGSERILWILFGAVSCVTLIGSANLINLYLTRLGKRRKELVVRQVLGARYQHIVRQWLTESALISIMGGAVGVTLSLWLIHLLRVKAPFGLPRAEEISMDPVIVTYGFLMSLLVGVGMSVIPLVHVLRQKGNANVLKSRENDGNAHASHRRSWLVASQVSIATVLLISAALLWNSFQSVMRIDPGFVPDQILTARVVLSGSAYNDDEALRGFFQRFTEKVTSLPEVSEAGMVNSLPLADINFMRPFTIENVAATDRVGETNSLRANYISVSTNYFDLMNIPIRAGRSFRPTDEAGEPTVVINESFAQHYFPQGQAVGQRIKMGPGRWRPWMTIVGVTADVKTYGREADSKPTFYLPYQHPAFMTYTLRGMFLVAKIQAPAAAVVNRLQRELAQMDPELALANIETMQGRLSADTADRRYHVTLMGLFAGLALILAIVGLFGVLSCMVAQRRREIGIRMALGSNRSTLVKLILKQGLQPVLIGIACGWVLSWAAQNLIAGFLFEISAQDPVTFISVGMIFVLTAAAACLLPAYRAAQIDPMEALRDE